MEAQRSTGFSILSAVGVYRMVPPSWSDRYQPRWLALERAQDIKQATVHPLTVPVRARASAG